MVVGDFKGNNRSFIRLYYNIIKYNTQNIKGLSGTHIVEFYASLSENTQQMLIQCCTLLISKYKASFVQNCTRYNVKNRIRRLDKTSISSILYIKHILVHK